MALQIKIPPPEHFRPGDTLTIHLPRAARPGEIKELRRQAREALPGIKIEFLQTGDLTTAPRSDEPYEA